MTWTGSGLRGPPPPSWQSTLLDPMVESTAFAAMDGACAEPAPILGWARGRGGLEDPYRAKPRPRTAPPRPWRPRKPPAPNRPADQEQARLRPNKGPDR